MQISSRTPEGEPQRCPVCGQQARIELSTVSADAPCPFCGSLLWLRASGTRTRSPGVRRGMVVALTKALVFIAVLLAGFVLGSITGLAIDHRVLGLGPMELAILGIIGVVLFGKQLPEAARWLGRRWPPFRLG
jgi:hypothetical protein